MQKPCRKMPAIMSIIQNQVPTRTVNSIHHTRIERFKLFQRYRNKVHYIYIYACRYINYRGKPLICRMIKKKKQHPGSRKCIIIMHTEQRVFILCYIPRYGDESANTHWEKKTSDKKPLATATRSSVCASACARASYIL